MLPPKSHDRSGGCIVLTRDQAICLRAVDYSETSQVVTFFTRGHGKLGAIAKGSKRPKSGFGGPIERLTRGEILFSASSTGKLATLTEYHQVHDVVLALSTDLQAYYSALFGTELLTKLSLEHAPRAELFDRFQDFLLNIRQVVVGREDKQQLLGLLIIFQLALLRDGGILPNFASCVNCTRGLSEAWQAVYFSSDANGLVCTDCEMSFPHRSTLPSAVALALSDFRRLSQASDETLRFTEKLLIDHFTGLLHQPPKMAKFLELGVP